MKVRFYNFSKKEKSTGIVSGSWDEIDVLLKDSCNIEFPVFLCDVNVAAYNYFYIPSWNRYYFISGALSVDNMWEVSGTEDYLASYKTEIGAISCNVLYASGSTKNIVDTRIPVKADVLVGHSYSAIPDITINDTAMGAIILGITGKGSFGTYLLKNSADLPDLLDGIDLYVTDLQTEIDGWKMFFYGGNAAQNIKGAIALPIVVPAQGTAEDLYLGGYPCEHSDGTHIQGYRITNPIMKTTGAISIPWQSTDWKKTAQYSTVSIYFPLIGIISCPATELQAESSITYSYSINLTSGDISIEVRATASGKKIATASGNCAMNTPFGNTGLNISKATSAVASGIGTAAAAAAAIYTGGLSTAGAIAIGSGIAATAGSTISAMGGDASGSGGLGGGATQGLDKVVHCWVVQKQLTDTQDHFNPIMGKPFMGVAKPSDFSGFVQTDGFQFKSNRAYLSEIQKINELLDSGIYYE